MSKKDQKEQLPYKDIIKQCEQTLRISKQENQEIIHKSNKIIQKLHEVDSIIITLSKEERLLRKDNDELEYMQNERKKIINYIDQLMQVCEGKDHSFELDIKHHQSYQQVNKLQGRQKVQGENLIKSIQHTETTNVKLEALFQELQYEHKELAESGAFWTCVRCGSILKEGMNEETCIYHPGKLKYYSCRNCGADEYFTCCNMCRECCKGCTKGLHKPG